MTGEQAFWFIVIYIAVLIVLFGWLIVYLLKRLKDARKPLLKPSLDLDRLKEIYSMIDDSSLEERMFMLKGLMGNCKIICSVSYDGIIIEGASNNPEDVEEDHRKIDYAG